MMNRTRMCTIAAALVTALLLAGPLPAMDSVELEGRLASTKNTAKRSKLYLEYAHSLLEKGDRDLALTTYQKALSENPPRKERYELLTAAAEQYLNDRRYELAIESYQEAVSLFPRVEKARLMLARAYELSELSELARQEYEAVLGVNRKSFEAHMGLASLYLRQGFTSKAMEQYMKALTIRPNAEIYRNVGRCAEASGDVPLALAMFRQIGADERRFEDHISLGRLYAAQKDLKAAEESFSQAVKCDPGSVEGYIYLALFYLDNGELTPAEKLLQIALEKAPGEGVIHFFLGTIYARQHRTAEADIEFKWAEELAATETLRRYSRKFSDYLGEKR